MTKRHNIIVITSAIIISVITRIYITKNGTSGKSHTIESRIFQGLNGWGYDILVDDTLFIHQESVPVMTGTDGFAKKEYAEQAARLVIKKMKKGEPPAVTASELEKIIPLNKLQYGQSGTSQ